MIKAKVSATYKDIERIFAGGSIQKEILKVWSTEADEYVFEAWRVLEIEALLPITIRANGEPLIDYRIYGNTEQSGTPTPENPIIPIGCGERTENLFDQNSDKVAGFIDDRGNIVQGDNEIWTYDYIGIYENMEYTYLGYKATVSNFTTIRVAWFDTNKSFISRTYILRDGINPRTVTSPSNARYARLSIDYGIGNIALFAGSTAPATYEPYGYKLSILSNSTVTSIYLGEAETTRRIKKLVLTGEENWRKDSDVGQSARYYITISDIEYNTRNLLSSHFTQSSMYEIGTINVYRTICVFSIDKTLYPTTNDFKAYLSTQYAAGTPVTIWYVLAEPETGIVNEPLMKIGDYADTASMEQAGVSIPTNKGTTVIDYDGEKHLITSDGYELVDKNQNGFLLSGSTLRPSKMYIKYKGR